MGLIHDALSGRGGGITKTKDITENGTYKAVKDGCDGYSEVYVDVKPKICDDTTITENGIYFVPEGFDGFGDITVDVQSVGLDDIVKLPTYANFKFGNFEYLFKVGSAIGKKRQFLYATYNNAAVMESYSIYDITYIVICEKSVPVLAYEHMEWNKKDESYDWNGNLTSTNIYSGETIVKNKLDRYEWQLTFERKRTVQYADGRNPDVYTVNASYTADTNPFRYYKTFFTSLTEASLKDFGQRLYIALNALS